MNGKDAGDQQMDELIEQYAVFLRGRGPEPDLGHLTPARRRAARARLEIVDTLFGLDAEMPAIEHDPVAIRLGLVPALGDSARGDGPAAVSADARNDRSGVSPAGVDVTRRVLDELEADFAGQVVIDWDPTWMPWSHSVSGTDEPILFPLAQCSVLGDAVAMFLSSAAEPLFAGSAISPVVENAPERHHSAERAGRAGIQGGRMVQQLALFLRMHPEVSSVGLVSSDGAQAAILPAAACHRAIDPIRGWLEPGELVTRDDLRLTVARYFEQRLPRWERVAGLAEVLPVGDEEDGRTQQLIAQKHELLLSARPRLEHKRHAQSVLRRVDLDTLASLIADVGASRIGSGDFVDRVEALVGDTL